MNQNRASHWHTCGSDIMNPPNWSDPNSRTWGPKITPPWCHHVRWTCARTSLAGQRMLRAWDKFCEVQDKWWSATLKVILFHFCSFILRILSFGLWNMPDKNHAKVITVSCWLTAFWSGCLQLKSAQTMTFIQRNVNLTVPEDNASYKL